MYGDRGFGPEYIGIIDGQSTGVEPVFAMQYTRRVNYDPDFIDALPKLASEANDPIYWLWVFDPQDDVVHLEHNEDRHPARHITHTDLAERVPHPERVHGYAYRIHGGWRITESDHGPVDDPHIKHLVTKALHAAT